MVSVPREKSGGPVKKTKLGGGGIQVRFGKRPKYHGFFWHPSLNLSQTNFIWFEILKLSRLEFRYQWSGRDCCYGVLTLKCHCACCVRCLQFHPLIGREKVKPEASQRPHSLSCELHSTIPPYRIALLWTMVKPHHTALWSKLFWSHLVLALHSLVCELHFHSTVICPLSELENQRRRKKFQICSEICQQVRSDMRMAIRQL